MSFGKLTILGLILWVILLFEKYVFFQIFGFSSDWQVWVHYIFLIILARVISRRFGVINILEAFFAGLVWSFIILVLDFLLARVFIDAQMFRSRHYWLSYFTLIVAVFFLHKKRHIQVRKELQAHHHGHH